MISLSLCAYVGNYLAFMLLNRIVHTRDSYFEKQLPGLSGRMSGYNGH